MQYKFTKKTYCLIWAVAALFFSVLVSHTVLPQYFEVVSPLTNIEIEATASKKSPSWGTDVRIVEVKIDDTPIPWSDFEKTGEWTDLDGLLIAINPSSPAVIEYSAQNARTVEITFSKNEGSGIVKITANNRKLSQNSLYSPEFENFTISESLTTISVLSEPVLFLCLFLAIYGLGLLFFFYLLPNTKNSPYFMSGLRKLLLLFAFFGIISIFSHEINAAIGVALTLYLLLILSLLLSNLTAASDRKETIFSVSFNVMTLLMASVVAIYIVEGINGNIGSLSPLYIAGNSGIYFALMLLLQILFRSVRLSTIVGNLIAFIYGTANYFVTLFRGSPIVPGDFFVIGTAKNVIQNYTYQITPELLTAVVILIIWCFAVWKISAGIKKTPRRFALIGVFPFTFLAWYISTANFYLPNLDLWDLNNNTKEYGLTMSLVSNIRRLNVSAPEGYSLEALETLCEQYKTSDSSEYRTPNVIAIMNESYSDLGVIYPNLDNETYMAYYNSLDTNTVKGHLLVSTIGGGTSNSEYEFLTGNSIAFVPGTVPYQQFVLKDTFSLARLFKDRGYTTLALHPYDGSGYNRERVYSYFGFDYFYDIDSFTDPELVRDRYISDKDSYQKVIDLYEEYSDADHPVFIFNVTMQNHSDYSTGYYGDDTVQIPGYEGDFPDAEEYLTLIRESDNAIPVLIDYFSNIEEPTVIVLFGDHQPKISDDFYEAALGKPLEDWSLDEAQERFIVPFFIWANYDIEEESNIFTSANYLSSLLFQVAGIKPVPYQNYLMEQMKKIPAMNINGYYNQTGDCFGYWEENEFTDILDTNWQIQYNDMFDSAKCEQWFSD